MEIIDIIGIAGTIILALGGGGVIILLFSNYIGQILASRYLESIRIENQKNLEEFKNELNLLKEKASRYSSTQFELYATLYHSLIDLKEKADILWENANQQTLKQFSIQFKKTKKEVEKGYLFLEEEHYNKFVEIFQPLEQYEIGKKSILKLAEEKENYPIYEEEIRSWITNNQLKKEEYSNLLKEVRKDLRLQLKVQD